MEPATDRASLVARLKSVGGRGVAEWLSLLRFDYSVASASSSHSGFKKLLQSYRTAISQISAEQRRTAGFIDLLTDEACVHMHVDLNLASQSLKAIKSLPAAQRHVRFITVFTVFQVRHGDVHAAKRLLETVTTRSDAGDELEPLRALLMNLNRDAGAVAACDIEPVVCGATHEALDDVVSFKRVTTSTLAPVATVQVGPTAAAVSSSRRRMTMTSTLSPVKEDSSAATAVSSSSCDASESTSTAGGVQFELPDYIRNFNRSKATPPSTSTPAAASSNACTSTAAVTTTSSSVGEETVDFNPRAGQRGKQAEPAAAVQVAAPAQQALDESEEEEEEFKSSAGELKSSGDPFAALSSTHETVLVDGTPYLKLSLAGRGGSSRVYRVLGPDMNLYALKRVSTSRSDASSYANEISLLNSLKSCPHVITLLRSSVTATRSGGVAIDMVMELGSIDLASMLARAASSPRSGAWSVIDPVLMRLLWQAMLRAVHAIHTARIVHGDLKPANFVFVQGELKLIDFGIARSMSADTTNIVRESTVGTLNYMSPEAIGGSGRPELKVGRASDIWSLGCILYQMVTGVTPFAHLALLPKMRAIADPAVQVEFPAIPDAALDAVVRACLQRDPARRPAIAGPDGLLEHPFLQPHNAARRAAAIVSSDVSAAFSHVISLAGEDTDKARSAAGAYSEAIAAGDAPQLRVIAASLPVRPPRPAFADAISAAAAAPKRAAPPPVMRATASPRGGRSRATSQPPPRALAASGEALTAAIRATASSLRHVDKENVAQGKKAAPSSGSGLEAVLRKGLSERFAAAVAARAHSAVNTSSAGDMDMTWTSTA